MDKESKRLVMKGVVIGVLSTIAAVLLGIILFSTIGMLAGRRVATIASIEKITLLENIIDKYYIEDVSVTDLRDGMYKGLVKGLGDEYSEYLTADEYAAEQEEDDGNYVGIGVSLYPVEKKGALIIELSKDSPAKKAGLKVGDCIIQADDVKYSKCENLEEFISHVKGKKGSSVVIRYLRDGKEKVAKVAREPIDVSSVEYEMLESDIAFIQIYAFNNNTDEQFAEVLEETQAKGAKGYIFDLRTNGGGMVDACTKMLDMLLGEGTTVYTIDRKGHKNEYKSDEAHKLDAPIVVLTSKYTASASEIFTGAIRDFKAGTIIGEKTYGKGVVQGTIPFFDKSALVITIAKYYTPKGECINKKGIKPDIEMDLQYFGEEDDVYDPNCDSQVQRAIDVIKGELK